MSDSYPKPFWVGTEVEGQSHFNGDCKDELPISRMEKLTVVGHTDNPNWVKVRNAHGQEGLVPTSYLTAVRRENCEVWFRGKITREQAEMVLTPEDDGHFLVRESTNFPGDYTLCVCFQNKVEHYRIISKDKKLTIDEESYFDNLAQLVEHYEKDADGLCTQLKMLEFNKDSIEVRRWCIDRRQLTLTDCIGKGEFGDVHLGDWLGRKVAVKGVKDNSIEAKTLINEASVMAKLEHHNLVALLGIVWEESCVLLVTEYMVKGSLVDYLRTRGRLLITNKDQINFACDAARGMRHLESMKVVHRDLAARNVLLNEHGTAKVCDFGLARSKNYKLEGGKFPIKWTAPEALRQNKFSNKSDMWSFGILLWEIYSFGRVPYPRIPLVDVIKYVEKGNRMEPPEDCPPTIYGMMEEAWDADPDCRPTFGDIFSRLDQIQKQHII